MSEVKPSRLARALQRSAADAAFRERLLADPVAALAEMGLPVPDSMTVVTHDTAGRSFVHLALPPWRGEGTWQGWDPRTGDPHPAGGLTLGQIADVLAFHVVDPAWGETEEGGPMVSFLAMGVLCHLFPETRPDDPRRHERVLLHTALELPADLSPFALTALPEEGIPWVRVRARRSRLVVVEMDVSTAGDPAVASHELALGLMRWSRALAAWIERLHRALEIETPPSAD